MTHRWPRYESDDFVCGWHLEEKLDNEVRQRFWSDKVLAPTWDAPAARVSPPGTPQLDIRWFRPKAPMLDDETGDRVFRQILAGTGEWLPLAGEAAGQSWFHSTYHVAVDKAACVHTDFDHVIWAFDEPAIKTEQLARVPGVGHVWFESDPNQGLRRHVHDAGLTGVGFVKCWDSTRTYRYHKWWNDAMRQGADVWS